MKIDRDKILARVKYWRKIFHLDTLWDIQIKIVSLGAQMPEGDKDAAGVCASDASYFQAAITLCEENIQTEAFLELTIIHELLHVVMDPLERAASSGMSPSHDMVTELLVESTIERIARAFVTVDKARKK